MLHRSSVPLLWHRCGDGGETTTPPTSASKMTSTAVFHVKLPARGAFERYVDVRSSVGTQTAAAGAKVCIRKNVNLHTSFCLRPKQSFSNTLRLTGIEDEV